MRKNSLPLTLICCVLLPGLVSVAAALLKCPECANMVSESAVACPKCGAPIALIKEAVAVNSRTNAAVHTENRNCVASIQTDTASGFGVIVAQAGTQFVIFDQRLIEGAESLTILATTTNTLMRYDKLELATDRPLARLVTDSTSVIPLRMSSAGAADANDLLSLSVVSTNGQVSVKKIEGASQDSRTVSLNAAPGRMVCVCDSMTNLVAVVLNKPSDNTAIKVGGVVQWIAVEPADFRKQTRLLAQATASAENGRTDRAQRKMLGKTLESTSWLTPHLRERATAIIQTLSSSN